METEGKGARRAGGTRGDPQVLPAGLSQVNMNAAGIDVGAESHFAAVPEDRCDTPVREFEAFTGDLYRMADWFGRVRHRDRGPGVDGGVLDPALRSAGGAGVRGAAGGPEGHQECARPQDRCAG